MTDKCNEKKSDVVESAAERFRKLGNEQFKAGRYGEAINLYTKSLEKVKTWEAHSNRAAAFLKLRRFDHALHDSTEVLAIDKNNFKGLFRLAQSFFGMKQSVNAVMTCENGLEFWPGQPDLIKLLKDIRDYEKRTDLSQFRTLFVYPSNIVLTAMDSEVSYSIRVVVKEYLDEDAMECFRSVDPVCFSDYIGFDSVDFSKISGSFRELFDGLVKAKEVALCSVKGVDDAPFCHALNNFSCFCNAWSLNLSDPFQKCEKPLVIKIGVLFSFLHIYKGKSRYFMIDYRSLDIEIEALWEMLVKKFSRETEKSPFLLEIRCPDTLVKPKERYERNLRTSEMLEMRADLPNLFAGEPGVSNLTSGYIMGIRRINL
uniref:Uncharacterized protein n=1 Tax=Ditylenchus dipsaci TaxID=166011 RepID=A0A915EF60_9BILA